MSAYSQQSKNTFKTWILIFLFVGMISAAFYIFGIYNNSPIFGIIGLFLSLGQAFVAYFFGDKIALAQSGAKRVKYEEAPQIYEIVQNLSKIAGIPEPKIHISPDRSANAFACGRSPKNASICLNQGLLNLLDKPELEGVIAHELAHIKNRDILIMTVTMVLSSIASFLADVGFRIMIFGGGNNKKENNSPILTILYIATIILVPILSAIIQMSVSRQREFLADASAVVMTRYPVGLKNALLKLYNNPVPANNYATSMNHFYIAPPKKVFGEKFKSLFSTHPTVQERVKALEGM
jgi:heat shock protein HtpX